MRHYYNNTIKLIIAAILLSWFVPSTAHGQDLVIAEYSTHYAWRGPDFRDRAHNIALAASKIDGIVVAPGETFSYNDTVGARTSKRGFREAHVIISGDLVDGMGGGVCQVSSTLHAATLLAGLVMIEERPHSRASVYIGPSLDATVAYGSFDFKFMNSLNFPIKIQASANKGQMVVKILGREDPYDVAIDFDIHKKRSYKTRWYVNHDMKPGTKKRREPGTYGYDLDRVRTIRNRRGVIVTREVVKYHYEPSDRIWDVGR